MSGLCNDFINFESRQLSTFTRFRTLRHLDLDFLRIDEIFGSDSKSSRCHLLGFAVEADAIKSGMETLCILPTFSCVASRTELVHGKTDGLVRLF